MASIKVARSRAVVVLFRPALNALPSSTPRSTRMFFAPSAWAVALARVAPASSMSAFVARLLDRVIIRSISSRTVTREPTMV